MTPPIHLKPERAYFNRLRLIPVVIPVVVALVLISLALLGVHNTRDGLGIAFSIFSTIVGVASAISMTAVHFRATRRPRRALYRVCLHCGYPFPAVVLPQPCAECGRMIFPRLTQRTWLGLDRKWQPRQRLS